MKVVTAEQCKEINLDYKEKFHKLLEDASVLSDACEAYEIIIDKLGIYGCKLDGRYLIMSNQDTVEVDEETAEKLKDVIDFNEK